MLQEQLRLPSAMAEKFGDSCAKQEENHPYIYLKSFHALVKRSDSAKAEFVYREALGTPPREPQIKLAGYVHWQNDFEPYSTLDFTVPVEFEKAGLILSELSKQV